MKKRILLILLIFTLSIGFVSASENTTDHEDISLVDSNDVPISDDETVNVKKVYVNASKETNGDGSSWENATNRLNVRDGDIFYLSEGEYGVSDFTKNYTVIGSNDNTIITSLWSYTSSYRNFNIGITYINVTFKVPPTRTSHYMTGNDDAGLTDIYIYHSISLDGRDFNFINCTFLDTSIVSGQNQYQNPNKDGVTDICSANFENCKFLNYSYNPDIEENDVKTSWGAIIHTIKYESRNLITSYAFTKYSFNNCIFDNVTEEVIVDSYGGQTDNYGRYDGVYIYNSTFKNCNIQGIVKARQLSYCEIVDCIYDFDASEDVGLVSPFYVNKTKKVELNETKLTITSKDNNVVIALTDVNASKPIAGVEVGIFNNGIVFGYFDTDSNGQIILTDLEGTYRFEFSYLGDPYAYLPTSVNKTLIFNKTKSNAVIQAPKVTAIYNVAKNLVITLKDSNGNALFGKYVTVKVGSVSKRLKTDKNGKVSLNVATLVPKTYTATVKFAGDDGYLASSVSPKVVVSKAKPKITAKAKTFKVKVKTKKYTVTLKNNKGKVLKKVKLTLKVGKKTYKATTNSKGKATFKITKLSKKGKYTATVKFAGSKYYKALSKKVKITVKK